MAKQLKSKKGEKKENKQIVEIHIYVHQSNSNGAGGGGNGTGDSLIYSGDIPHTFTN